MFEPGRMRREVIACLAAANEGGEAFRLSMFGPPEEEELLNDTIDDFSLLPDKERLEQIVSRLKFLVAQEDFVGLGEIHPAWLVEALSKESPRIIGIILRYLPSKQVRYIIEHLPKRIKSKLPQLIDSFAVSAPILKIIRERFERQFISAQAPRDIDEFKFEHVAFLKNSELEILFKDLGIQEMAMALKGVDRRSLNILFNRMSIDEARSLQQRIRSLIDVSPSILKEAKYTVLEMSLSETNPSELLMDIGLNAFARSLVRENLHIFPVIKQKLEPRLGYMLKRYIDQHISSNLKEASENRKKMILSRIEALVKAGIIESDIAKYFVGAGETQEFRAADIEEDESASEVLPKPEKSDGWHRDNGVI